MRYKLIIPKSTAMKSQFQTLSFLSNYTPKTPLDAEFINSFLVQRFQVTPKTLKNASNSASTPLDVQSFISWFENGSEALKIARYNQQIVLLGNCTLDTCEIIASMSDDGSLNTEPFTIDSKQIETATKDEIRPFQDCLSTHELQPAPDSLTLVPKFIPQMGDRVTFFDYALEVQGVGVVREVTDDGDVIFFCYFTYPTYSQEHKLGYSLYENPGYNINSMIFENINKENTMTTLGNSTSCYRRLGRELERAGKVWKDKLLRVEPIQGQVPVGDKYHYISDKMKVVTETEKGTPTSKFRWLAGNYFTTHMAATKMLGKWNEDLRNYLASDEWPEINLNNE